MGNREVTIVSIITFTNTGELFQLINRHVSVSKVLKW